MRVMVISDLHYEKRRFKGVDESVAWTWLMNVVDYHKPDYLLSCGDWGLALNTGELYELLEKTIVLSIHGNHENIGVLETARNLRAHLPVLMRDGRVYEIPGLRIAGINGAISETRRKTKEGVPYKSPEEYLSVARSLRERGVDILLIHEVPYIPGLLPSVKKSTGSITALKAIEISEPRLVFGGHVHEECLHAYGVTPRTLYICLDSSQHSKQYLVLAADGDELKIEKWRDREFSAEIARIKTHLKPGS